MSRCLLLLLPLFLAGCAQVGSRPDASVTGTVTYLERIALPSGSLLRVTLLDVSDGAEPVAEVEIAEPRVPVAFNLRYDPRAIDSQHRYLVQAQISVDGRLLFLTTEEHAVITGDAGTRAHITVRRPGVTD